MIFTLGILLNAAYLGFLVMAAALLRDLGGAGSLLIFFAWAFLGALMVGRAQERLERYFITRHARKNPQSNWDYLLHR